MANSYVKHIRRTRSSKTVDEFSKFDDDELPPWDEGGHRVADKLATTNVSNDIGTIAAAITQRLYPDNGNSTWPDDYSSKTKEMKKNEIRDAFRVEWALYKALTTALVGSLSDHEFKIMLFILNRTWGWKKPREGIPFSQFSKGVFIGKKGEKKRIQAPVATSPGHFNNACKHLEAMRLIQITDAQCKNGSVNVYEINVERVINLAANKQRSALML